MSLELELKNAGFAPDEIAKLSQNRSIVLGSSNKTGNAIPLVDKIRKIAKIHNVPEAEVRKAILSFPPFAGLDHHRVLAAITSTYGCIKDQATKAILSFP